MLNHIILSGESVCHQASVHHTHPWCDDGALKAWRSYQYFMILSCHVCEDHSSMKHLSESAPVGQRTRSHQVCRGSVNCVKLLTLSVVSLATTLLLLIHCRLHPVLFQQHTLLTCCGGGGKRTVRVVLEDESGVVVQGNYSAARTTDGHNRKCVI